MDVDALPIILVIAFVVVVVGGLVVAKTALIIYAIRRQRRAERDNQIMLPPPQHPLSYGPAVGYDGPPVSAPPVTGAPYGYGQPGPAGYQYPPPR